MYDKSPVMITIGNPIGSTAPKTEVSHGPHSGLRQRRRNSHQAGDGDRGYAIAWPESRSPPASLGMLGSRSFVVCGSPDPISQAADFGVQMRRRRARSTPKIVRGS